MARSCTGIAAASVLLTLASVATAADGPAYQIVLRSRIGAAAPHRTRDAQTGGGWIDVEQPEPNTIVVTMGGAAVAGSEFHGSAAGIGFDLGQDLDIIALRPNVRPPRVGMVGRLVGTLQVTDPGKCGKSCGTSEQGPATASLTSGDASLLAIAMNPVSATCGQELSINHREGPVEAVAAIGAFRLNCCFRIGVTQGKGVFYRQAAAADFDPGPQLDASWANVLKPFRAVPRRDFGYRVILRVVENPLAEPLQAPPMTKP